MLTKFLIRAAIYYAVLALLLFDGAGTLNWPAGWWLLILLGGTTIMIGVWLARHDPGLLAERMGGPFQRGQERWDKIFMVIVMAMWVAVFTVMPLDAVRFQFSHMPLWLQCVGAVLLLAGTYIAFLAFRENSFAAVVVKVQRERGHAAVTTGPYALVRHPFYSGALLMFIGIPLLVGSWIGLALGLVLCVLMAMRAIREENMLVANLDGYADYAARVRYRIIPNVW